MKMKTKLNRSKKMSNTVCEFTFTLKLQNGYKKVSCYAEITYKIIVHNMEI